jgi:hypothetical protein
VEEDADSGTLTAILPAVPWAREAALLVVSGPGREALIVDLRHESVTVQQGENLASEPRDTVLLHRTPATPIASGPGHAAIRSRLALLWSAAVAGAARGAYRLTKAYVSERQFGAPLLRIPAVSSGLALMKVQLLQAEATLALAEVARLAYQLARSMGITQEYPLHHVTRRLWAWRGAVAGERDWSDELGRRAADLGETGVWTRLSAAGSQGGLSPADSTGRCRPGQTPLGTVGHLPGRTLIPHPTVSRTYPTSGSPNHVPGRCAARTMASRGAFGRGRRTVSGLLYSASRGRQGPEDHAEQRTGSGTGRRWSSAEPGRSGPGSRHTRGLPDTPSPHPWGPGLCRGGAPRPRSDQAPLGPASAPGVSPGRHC